MITGSKRGRATDVPRRKTCFCFARGRRKICPACGHKHKAVLRVDGKVQRVKNCLKCGEPLPSKLTASKKASVKWFVREWDPASGQCKDYACGSSEEADELIRQKERDWTPDSTQTWLLEHTSVLIRGIKAQDREEAINSLILKLGGDPARRMLKPVSWNEAREAIADELRQKGRSEQYVQEMLRITADFGMISGLSDWSSVDLEAITRYRGVRMKGGWERNGRVFGPVGGRAINKDLATLSAFLARAVRKQWIVSNPLENAPDERIKVQSVRVDYMPDEDLRTLIAAAETVWMRTFVIVAYYTGARRSDLLKLEWENDVDLDGTKIAGEGRVGPHIYVRGSKADTPHWMPLHPAAVQALRGLRAEPIIGPQVFPIKGSKAPKSYASRLFARLCIRAGLTEEVEHNGVKVVKNKWTLHDLRRKAKTDLRNRGASAKERAALLGHRTTAVNEAHYEALLPGRDRQLVDSLPAFGRSA